MGEVVILVMVFHRPMMIPDAVFWRYASLRRIEQKPAKDNIIAYGDVCQPANHSIKHFCAPVRMGRVSGG